MKKNKGLIVATAFVAVLGMGSAGLVACGSSGQQEQAASSAEQQQSVDEQFMQALSSGLQARWSVIDPQQSTSQGESKSDEDKDEDEEYTQDQWRQATQAEYDAVKGFEGATFEDAKLGKLAKQYISAMEDSVKAVDYYNNDSKFLQKYTNDAYPRRVSALYQINEISPITVGQDRQSNLTEVLTDGESHYAAQKILSKAKFKKQKDEYPGSTYHEYAAVVKNDSKVDYDWFQLDISLVDKKGVTVQTTSASTDNWEAGTKHRFEFSTDKKFKKIDIASYEFSLD